MRVLLIKTSSMGDVIHTLPALTDAATLAPSIQFDWLVEENFAEIPGWHHNVNAVIPIHFRQWRKDIFSKKTWHEWRTLYQQLKHNHYDLVLDAQGLVKSALFSLCARTSRVGLDWRSAREPLASLFYQKKLTVNFEQHAIHRMRSLFSLAFNYTLPDTLPDFGIQTSFDSTLKNNDKYVVFLHGTSWKSKLWPENFWIQLAALVKSANYRIKISGGNAEEIARAHRIAAACDHVDVLPQLRIQQMAALLANAKASVAVDTGFGHLSAALNTPTISLYGATDAAMTGALGKHSMHLSANFPCSPCLKRACVFKEKSAAVLPACFNTITPTLVWKKLFLLLS